MIGIYSSTYFTIERGEGYGCKINFEQGIFDICRKAGNRWTLLRVVSDAVEEVLGTGLQTHFDRPDSNDLGDYEYASVWGPYGGPINFMTRDLERLGDLLYKKFNANVELAQW